MGRKGWILLAVCVAAVVVGAILYVRSGNDTWVVRKVQPHVKAPATAPVADTGGTQAPQAATAQPVQAARVVTYTVRRGDTLGAISRRFLGSSLKWRAIANENGIRGEFIKPGMKLHITVVTAT
ncbi:MAG: LysM peptidoglycan-binding domain-containing protein [Candidatus Brocadiia bacterium]|jgi:nucleoid-associated protein YgaU